MTERKVQEQELEETKGRLEAIINQMPVGIMVADARTGEILFTNDEIERMYGLGFKPTDIKTFTDYTRMARHHLDGRPYDAKEYPFYRSLSGEMVRNELAEILRPDGSEVFINGSSAPVHDPNGNITASVALSIDVTEQIRTQRERDKLLAETEDYSKKLQRSNDELKQFAYVASHDLQEPLRMVTAYLGLLEKRFGDQLDGDAKKYMDFAIEGGARARDLIRDLLEFSRVDSQGGEFLPTDMEQVFEKVVAGLKIQVQDEHATITHDDLPMVMADETQLISVLQNLITNAIKFHGNAAPRVHISCRKNGKEYLFSVQDNGIGIDPQYKDKVFVLFRRLHTRDKYEGTGIGLAIAKKIVERHGGKNLVRVRGREGNELFFFTIPKF